MTQEERHLLNIIIDVLKGLSDAQQTNQEAIVNALSEIKTAVSNIKISADSINLNTDTLESLIQTTNNKLDDLDTNIESLAAKIGEIDTNTDTLETLIGTTNTNLNAINTSITNLNTNVNGVKTSVDAVNITLGTTNTSLAILANIDEVLDNIKLDTANIETITNAMNNTPLIVNAFAPMTSEYIAVGDTANDYIIKSNIYIYNTNSYNVTCVAVVPDGSVGKSYVAVPGFNPVAFEKVKSDTPDGMYLVFKGIDFSMG